jgi:hypothetical protein
VVAVVAVVDIVDPLRIREEARVPGGTMSLRKETLASKTA